MTRRVVFLILAAALLIAAAGCGYHVGGHADLLPQNLHTIYIPAFANNTTRYKLSDRLPEELAREFLARTRYRVVSREDQADMVLRGAVVNYYTAPIIFDPSTGRASAIQFGVTMQMSLSERTTGKVLFKRDNFEFRQRYEVSALKPTDVERQIDRNVYFDESEPAMQRLSQEVASSIVSAVVEAF